MTVTARQIKCRDMFLAQGYPLSGAAALVGNFCQESGPDLPTAFRTKNLDHGSNGLAQWRLDRLTSLKNFIDKLHPGDPAWYGNMQMQVDFVVHELTTDYPALNDKLRKGGDVAALTADVCWQYERPNKALSGIDKRIAWAKAIAAVKVGTEAKPSANPLITTASLTVVDHLQVEAASHTQQAQGGSVLAALSAVGAGALGVSHFADQIPMWEILTFGALAILLVVGVIGAHVQSAKASNVRLAIAGVTPDAPPAVEVEHTPVEAPAPAVAPSQDEVIAKLVLAEVNRRMSALVPQGTQGPATQGLVGQQAVVQDVGQLRDPATSGLSSAILDKDGKPVTHS